MQLYAKKIKCAQNIEFKEKVCIQLAAEHKKALIGKIALISQSQDSRLENDFKNIKSKCAVEITPTNIQSDTEKDRCSSARYIEEPNKQPTRSTKSVIILNDDMEIDYANEGNTSIIDTSFSSLFSKEKSPLFFDHFIDTSCKKKYAKHYYGDSNCKQLF